MASKSDVEKIFNIMNYHSPWLEINAFNWDKLTLDQPISKLKKNSMVFQANEPNNCVYVVKKGRLRLFSTNKEGVERALAIAQVGSLIGDFSVIDSKPNFMSAITITDTELYVIDKWTFLHKIAHDQELQSHVNINLSKQIRILFSHLESSSSRSAVSRIALTLMVLVEEYGIHKENHKISIKFTHQELANITGLNRVTVSNILSQFSAEGIIQKEQGHFAVRDLPKLMEYMEE